MTGKGHIDMFQENVKWFRIQSIQFYFFIIIFSIQF